MNSLCTQKTRSNPTASEQPFLLHFFKVVLESHSLDSGSLFSQFQRQQIVYTWVDANTLHLHIHLNSLVKLLDLKINTTKLNVLFDLGLWTDLYKQLINQTSEKMRFVHDLTIFKRRFFLGRALILLTIPLTDKTANSKPKTIKKNSEYSVH